MVFNIHKLTHFHFSEDIYSFLVLESVAKGLLKLLSSIFYKEYKIFLVAAQF